MSLTNSMKNLTQEITYGTKKRKESVASSKKNTTDMINIFKSKRMNDERENKNKRLQIMAELKDNVKNLLSNNFNARKTMSSDMRQSLDGFMNNLKNSTTTLLNVCKKERSLIAADILGAKAEWAGLQKKKVDNTHDEKEDMYFNSSNFHINKLELSGEVPNNGGFPDDLLFNKPLEIGSNNDDIIQNPIAEKENSEKCTNVEEEKDDIKLKNRVSSFIKKSKEGRKISEITELIKSIDENNNVQEFLLKMIDKGMIKKYKNRYYVVEDN
ncbi:hypothetical protein C4588_07660 [Candidatus Parcubacteria bacterium]|nr:MAG: hypothetical protein C4588_07660 [Candidatus Parcubacteria bacterium]